MTAITIPTGPDKKPKTAPSTFITVANPVAAAPADVIAPVTKPKALVTIPITLSIPPMMRSNGPIAAAIPKMMMMVCFAPSLKFPNARTTPVTLSIKNFNGPSPMS